ncbi:unnamed protein product [Meloidogyne enterolobii]|uniref:Uncharacterized protein n=1 Tax=Meloidogyne enterolobii TaxID=390850 RepID=A0ACB1B5L6_MELEN
MIVCISSLPIVIVEVFAATEAPSTYRQLLTKFEHALDCGSGIGRITKHLLLPKFNYVDMVDFAETFIEQSEKYIGSEGNSRVQNKFVESLHTFKPSPNFYDLIWIQWVTGQLSDDDLTNFLRRCKVCLFYCLWEFWG